VFSRLQLISGILKRVITFNETATISLFQVSVGLLEIFEATHNRIFKSIKTAIALQNVSRIPAEGSGGRNVSGEGHLDGKFPPP
jgi:hypothetical protein